MREFGWGPEALIVAVMLVTVSFSAVVVGQGSTPVADAGTGSESSWWDDHLEQFVALQNPIANPGAEAPPQTFALIQGSDGDPKEGVEEDPAGIGQPLTDDYPATAERPDGEDGHAFRLGPDDGEDFWQAFSTDASGQTDTGMAGDGAGPVFGGDTLYLELLKDGAKAAPDLTSLDIRVTWEDDGNGEEQSVEFDDSELGWGANRLDLAEKKASEGIDQFLRLKALYIDYDAPLSSDDIYVDNLRLDGVCYGSSASECVEWDSRTSPAEAGQPLAGELWEQLGTEANHGDLYAHDGYGVLIVPFDVHADVGTFQESRLEFWISAVRYTPSGPELLTDEEIDEDVQTALLYTGQRDGNPHTSETTLPLGAGDAGRSYASAWEGAGVFETPEDAQGYVFTVPAQEATADQALSARLTFDPPDREDSYYYDFDLDEYGSTVEDAIERPTIFGFFNEKKLDSPGQPMGDQLDDVPTKWAAGAWTAAFSAGEQQDTCETYERFRPVTFQKGAYGFGDWDDQSTPIAAELGADHTWWELPVQGVSIDGQGTGDTETTSGWAVGVVVFGTCATPTESAGETVTVPPDRYTARGIVTHLGTGDTYELELRSTGDRLAALASVDGRSPYAWYAGGHAVDDPTGETTQHPGRAGWVFDTIGDEPGDGFQWVREHPGRVHVQAVVTMDETAGSVVLSDAYDLPEVTSPATFGDVLSGPSVTDNDAVDDEIPTAVTLLTGALDSDGDGYNNVGEIRMNSAPTNRESTPYTDDDHDGIPNYRDSTPMTGSSNANDCYDGSTAGVVPLTLDCILRGDTGESLAWEYQEDTERWLGLALTPGFGTAKIDIEPLYTEDHTLEAYEFELRGARISPDVTDHAILCVSQTPFQPEDPNNPAGIQACTQAQDAVTVTVHDDGRVTSDSTGFTGRVTPGVFQASVSADDLENFADGMVHMVTYDTEDDASWDSTGQAYTQYPFDGPSSEEASG